MTKQKKALPVFLGLFLLATPSCTRVPDKIEPKIDYSVQDRYLQSLPSSFPHLTEEEKREEWGKEYRIAKGFAGELDLYRAITAFKRALYLLPKEAKERKLELQYEVILCYYIGKKYEEAIRTFENSELKFMPAEFPPKEDLLTILFDSYSQTNQTEKANQVLEYMASYYLETAAKLQLARALLDGNVASVKEFATKPGYDYLSPLLDCYGKSKKSIAKAQTLNAVLPGTGYLYLGQKQSAMTAFLLNGLFIGTSYYFFHKGNIPAGIIFTGFEAGWYFGGIYGAGEEAKFYNERIYERCATPVMNKQKLFPILSLRYAF